MNLMAPILPQLIYFLVFWVHASRQQQVRPSFKIKPKQKYQIWLCPNGKIWVLDHFTEKSFHRKFLTEMPFDRKFILPNRRLIERRLTFD
jgi:hypothetical protein